MRSTKKPTLAMAATATASAASNRRSSPARQSRRVSFQDSSQSCTDTYNLNGLKSVFRSYQSSRSARLRKPTTL